MTPENINQTKYNEIHQLFFDTAAKFPENIAMIAGGGKGKSYSYAEVESMVKNLASWLLSRNRMEKKEIGIISENRPEWGIAYLAILTAGGTVVPIDANLKTNEISYIVNHAELDLVFCSGKFESILQGIGRELKILSFEKDSANYFYPSNQPAIESARVEKNNTALLIYTSGTTGNPKAVELTHRNILSNLEGIKAALDFNSGRIFLSILPLHHTLEGTCGFLAPITSGCKIVYARSLKSKEIVEDIKNNRITCMCGVPLLYEKMHHSFMKAIDNAPSTRKILFKLFYSVSRVGWSLKKRWGRTLFKSLREKAGLGSIDFFVSGGAALPLQISKFFNLIGFNMIEGYGLTETSPALSFTRLDNVIFGSVGEPLDNVRLKINNPNDQGIGEIIVQGENITPGYRDNPEKTAELIKDGWLYTGDLGKIEKGCLFITGRAKNLIVSAAGKNIYPEEIEEKLMESGKVLEAVVFGRKKKDKQQGEDVCALIVPMLDALKEQYNISVNNPDMKAIHNIIAELVKEVNNQMATYKRITIFDVQLEELEKTSTKKVKRFVYK